MTRRRGDDWAGWGPSHQTGPDQTGGRRWGSRTLAAVLIIWTLSGSHPTLPTVVLIIWLLVVIVRRVHGRTRNGWPWSPRRARVGWSADPLAAVHAQIARGGGGTYLGVGRRGEWRVAGRERAVLVLGPPRSGKSSAVMIPALLAHQGAAVSASTKPDVLAATVGARSRLAEVWRFDPTGQSGGPAVGELRWSPVTSSGSWDGSLVMARSMVAGATVGAGTTDASHWAKRATALLAAMLHAAAIENRGIDVVLDWVLGHELDAPGVALEQHGARRACAVLTGLQNTEARERSSICSAAADAIDAYTSDTALAAATDPNFDAERFVRSSDTIYVHAPAEAQALAAPLVCGLLAEIRRATYQAHQRGELAGGVLFALDEVANIAPLAELPAIASEGGGQGLALIAALQDLSQARARWGAAADGFLTLFGSKLLLPGVADVKTLDAVSTALGEYDRRVVSQTRGRGRQLLASQRSHTVSTQRQRILSPGEIANLPAGQALHLDGVRWELLALTPAYRCEPWQTLTQLPRPSAEAGRAVRVER